jgi:hypothetical protein
MKKILSLTVLLLSINSLIVTAQSPVIKWQKTIGGAADDSLTTIVATADGGFIVSGYSNSGISGNKTQSPISNSFDYWIVKLNSTGDVLWDKTIGGVRTDKDPVVIPTSDGGYLVGGTSNSDSSGNKTEYDINDSYDYWVVKLDADGNVLWNNTIGGIQLDVLVSLAQAADGNYILGGYSYTIGDRKYDKTDGNRGSSLWADYWVVKLNSTGDRVLWNKVYGGKNEDILTSMVPTKDGGYMLGGYSYSPDEFEKSESFLGNDDYWIVKIDGNGNKVWDKIYGGSLSDYLTSISSTKDGGCIIGGYSNSPASFNKTGTFRGSMDYWILKTDSSRNVQWDKSYGGRLGDYLSSVQQTADGGYLVGGTSNSSAGGGKTENSKGLQDYWILKLNKKGGLVWNKTIGGTKIDRLSVIKELSSGEYILGGTSNSPVSGDKTDPTVGGTGQNDFWILRMSTNPTASQQPAQPVVSAVITNNAALDLKKLWMQATPNPTKGQVTVSYASLENVAATLIIYDNNGKTILQKSLAAGKSSFQLDLSKQAPGTYYAVLNCNNSSVTRVIVKE